MIYVEPIILRACSFCSEYLYYLITVIFSSFNRYLIVKYLNYVTLIVKNISKYLIVNLNCFTIVPFQVLVDV